MRISLDSRGKVVVLGCLFLIFLISWILPVWSVQYLTLASPRLNVGETLVSASHYYELAIAEFKNGKYYLCIRYAHPIQQTVVWVANRNLPLTFDGSYLKLSDGNLQLFDQDKASPLWSSGTTGATVAKLLDTGNLVLEDDNKNQLWNSFNSSITDTLLPGQYLQRTDPRQNTLISWSSRDNPATGNYTFGWANISVSNGTNVSALHLACHTCQTTLPTGGMYIPAPDVDNKHIISDADSVYFHPTLGGIYFTTGLVNPTRPTASTLLLSDFQQPSNTIVLKRLTLDIDGGLRIWQWKIGQSSPDWTPMANWVVNERGTQCFSMGTCGSFGLCQMTPSGSLDRVQCTCLEGFEPKDKSDFSRGCNPIVPLSGKDYCNTSGLFNMVEFDGLDLPWGGDIGNFTVETDLANCTTKCLNNCNCTAIVYSKAEQRCWEKKDDLINLGYPTVALHGNDRTAIIKISNNQPQIYDHKGRKLWILAPVLGGVFAISVVFCCIYRYRRSLPRICGGMYKRGINLKDHGIPSQFGGPPNAPPQLLV